jgi:carbohydrate-binding DOMON domain-containing protein
LEVSIPITDISPGMSAGDDITFRFVSKGNLLPYTAPAIIVVPDLGITTWLFSVTDPLGDDYGPGYYTYPTDGVFKSGVFDLTSFDVGTDGENLVFRIELAGLVDIYLDTTPSSGSQVMRDARNAAFPSGSSWDYVLSLAGWNYGVFSADNPEVALSTLPLTILTDPVNKYIIAKIPLASIPGDPLTWGYGVVVLSNDGYGKNGVREVAETGGQWVLGGALPDQNHTRIIDYLWPGGLTPTQEDMLSNYPSSTSETTEWTIIDYPQVLMYYPTPE